MFSNNSIRGTSKIKVLSRVDIKREDRLRVRVGDVECGPGGGQAGDGGVAAFVAGDDGEVVR